MEPSKKVTNSSLQADEIKALASIFGGEFKLEHDNEMSIKIYNGCDHEVYLQVTLPENYPLNSSPVCQLSAPWMNRAKKQKLFTKVKEICRQNIGESIIYQCVAAIKDFIEDLVKSEVQNDGICTDLVIDNSSMNNDVDDLPVIEHGEPIMDRKSTFQAHFAKVVSEKQVKLVMEKLKENGKIDSAKHNVYAYRILLKNGKFIQDFNDDGEAKAGTVLLHLLEISDLSNILIVVTRWYGGIHLGSYRFRHYNAAANSLLIGAGHQKKKIKKSRSSKR